MIGWISISLILAAAAGLGLIALKLLSWSRIRDWFRSRSQLIASDNDTVGFVIGDGLHNGKYKELVGFFNTTSGESWKASRTKLINSIRS